MTVNCSLISDGPRLIHCEYNFAIDSIRQKSSKIWIDIMDAGKTELDEKLNDLNVLGLIRHLCLDSSDHPGFYPLKPLALMVIPVQMEVVNKWQLEYLVILFCDDFLVSIRSSNMARFRKTITSEDSFDLLPDDTISGVLSALLMGLSLDCLRKASRMSEIILAMEEKMEKNTASVNIEEISVKRSELLTLESIVQGQLPIIEAIITPDRIAKNTEGTLEYLRWASANLKSADRKLEWLERRIEVIRTLIDMREQERTNRRLGRLTVLSMIFMPVTFLAGVWGMNFKSMPLLSVDYGYMYALIIMLIISGSMYLYFHRKGWFN